MILIQVAVPEAVRQTNSLSGWRKYHPWMKIFNPVKAVLAISQHRYLIGQLTRREVLLKYRGSVLGLGWSFLYPLLLLSAFTLVFGGVFGGHWGGVSQGVTGLEMALFLYCGLVVFTPFSEVITTAPRLLLANQNFVKKIIFPTEILPLVTLLSATIHGAAHVVLLLFMAFLVGHANFYVLLTPIVLLPVWLFTMGVAWFLTAAGAYVRDIAHGMPVLAQLLMFLLPVFYPMESSPRILRTINTVNPLAHAINDMRRTVLLGLPPDWRSWLVMFAMGLGIFVAGYVFFTRCQEDFADVL